MARPRFSGFLRTGITDLSAEMGIGSTPRNGPGAIATVTADKPRSAINWETSPPVEWPMTAGFLSSLPITSAVWSAICPSVFFANTSGFALASCTVSGSSGQPGVSAA
jgi:hypothetical protein